MNIHNYVSIIAINHKNSMLVFYIINKQYSLSELWKS